MISIDWQYFQPPHRSLNWLGSFPLISLIYVRKIWKAEWHYPSETIINVKPLYCKAVIYVIALIWNTIDIVCHWHWFHVLIFTWTFNFYLNIHNTFLCMWIIIMVIIIDRTVVIWSSERLVELLNEYCIFHAS